MKPGRRPGRSASRNTGDLAIVGRLAKAKHSAEIARKSLVHSRLCLFLIHRGFPGEHNVKPGRGLVGAETHSIAQARIAKATVRVIA